MGKAVTCTVSSCMGQNHRPSNCTKNYLRPERAEISQDAPVVLSTKTKRAFLVLGTAGTNAL